MFHLIQPWGRDKYREATVLSSHETLDSAYADIERLAEKLRRNGCPDDWLEIVVVDDDRQPVQRPGAN